MKKEENINRTGAILLGASIFLLGILWGLGSFDDSSYDDIGNFDSEDYLNERLEDEGFEVININIMDMTCNSPILFVFNDISNFNCQESYVVGKKDIHVEIKSLGNRADQIKKVISNSVFIEDIYGFWIEILSPTDTCTYVIQWEEYTSCLESYNCDLNSFLSEDSLLICK